ncbi:phosphonate monoester hydrolase [Mesobaculum littorinae]|uniref:Phosphonate monoester hydrolase n=1 Tax=Mesobaculum littorinae TaxID=2486419 RepID=A0A438AHB1_9RHOB|nr:alkaline phosphatase family protein [Mesobaculum littorinae]RVV98058.1 phosphonate monoester hydrolase [Mesobaculum littorinae]
MPAIKNILFIMADQLRADYLSCYGHPHIQTPAMDALAARGVRYDHAYVQAPICGPSRMSFYTGRYVASHGSTYNGVPLRVGEPTMGDHLRPLGLRTALVGKTHMAADAEGIRRLGLDTASEAAIFAAQCGFEPFERDDGLWPDRPGSYDIAYNDYLRAQGYEGDNPWHTAANSVRGDDGEVLSGWEMRHAGRPAIVAEEHSETAYMTDRAMDFIDAAGDQPWCLHLSYIKPHWPYIAPAPYHDMYGPDDVIPANRDASERDDPHPVYAAFMGHEESGNFAREEVRRTVIPAYMGLIRQFDDHIGRLFAFLEDRGLAQHTMIVVTSDHGDYLGDHWLGEKQLFHEESARVPLIVYDPRPEADATRGTVDSALVEAIDLVPTFVEAAGGTVPGHILEGRSLVGRLHGETGPWRDAVFSELDFGFRKARLDVGTEPWASRGVMLRTERWKYIEYGDLPPQLFDLETDPQERTDLGRSDDHAAIRADLHERLFRWLRDRRMRITTSDAEVEARTDRHKAAGIPYGVW